MTTITLGSLTFADFATSGWVFQDLIDWYGATDDKSPNEERPQGHGSFAPSRSLRSSKAISFKATYLGSTSAEVEDAYDELAAIGAEGRVRMTVATDRGAGWRIVSVVKSEPDDNYERSEGYVSVDVIAHDPRRYSDGVLLETGVPVAGQGVVWPEVWPEVWPGGGSDGRVALRNTGRAPSAPWFELVGGFASAVITSTATGALRRVGLDRPVPVGSSVVIDYGTRRAMLDGISDVSRWLRWREWEDVPPKSTSAFQFDAVSPNGAIMRGKVNPASW